MVFNIHAGHGNPMGRGCGAVGLLDESFEARRVKDELIRFTPIRINKALKLSYMCFTF